MRPAAWTLPLLGVVGVVAVACSLTTDLEGLAGGPDEARPDASGGPDAAGLDGGSIDAPSSVPEAGDAAVDSFVPSRCADAGVLLCDGFEEPFLDPGVWFALSGSPPTIDSARFYRGRQSLHMRTPATDGGSVTSIVQETQTFGAPAASNLWIRAFVYVPAPTPQNVGDLFWVAQDVAPYRGSYFSLRAGHVSLYDDFTGVFSSSATVVPTDRWTCLEWEVDRAAPQQMRVWVEGAELADLHVVGATEPPAPSAPLGHVAIGSHYDTVNIKTPQPALEVWLDEVIVDSQPIGCAK